MNGREFGEALERVVEAGRVALRDNYNFADRPPALPDDCVGISLADLRAALAQSAPQEAVKPQCKHPSSRGWGSIGSDGTSDGETWCDVCGKQLTFSKVNKSPQPESSGGLGDDVRINVTRGTLVVRTEHYERLRARDKWIEEHAKPALEYYRKYVRDGEIRALDVLAALPQDAGETK